MHHHLATDAPPSYVCACTYSYTSFNSPLITLSTKDLVVRATSYRVLAYSVEMAKGRLANYCTFYVYHVFLLWLSCMHVVI